MNGKQKRTLKAIFALPTPAGLAWADIESLIIVLGFQPIEGSGSRVRFVRGTDVLVVHRPHPRKEAKQYLVREVRDFLKDIGITP